MKSVLGDRVIRSTYPRGSLHRTHVPVVASRAPGECVGERNALNLVYGYGPAQEDFRTFRTSIRPPIAVIDIRLGLGRAVGEMNRDIQIVLPAPEVVISGQEGERELGDQIC